MIYLDSNAAKNMSDTYSLPRMIICENEKEGDCSSSTETEASTKEGDGLDVASMGKSESREEVDNADETQEQDDAKEQDLAHPCAAVKSGNENAPGIAAALGENLSELRLGEDESNFPVGEKHAPSTPILARAEATAVAASFLAPIVSPEEQAATAGAATASPSAGAANVIEIEEKDELSPLYVGRIIGKGGEMIRDLQARSGCRIDVHQDVDPPTAPRIITYKGKNHEDIDFAKTLVMMLCDKKDGEAHVELPLGQATMKHIQVPKSVIGRIIGRGGEMIRELQSKSHARIQVDHTGDAGMDDEHRRVTITGTEDSVDRAEEMILFLINNPGLDGHLLVSRRRDWGHPQGHGHGEHHGRQGHGQGRQQGYQHGSTPVMPMSPQASHPHVSMSEDSIAMLASSPGSVSYWGERFGSGQPLQQASLGYGATADGYDGWVNHAAPPPVIVSDLVLCSRADIGHIIGKRGVTINDLQHRTSCNIQIDQHDCRISIVGPRQGIELAKRMISEIAERGPNHSYAGGTAVPTGVARLQQQHQQQLLPHVESGSSSEQLGYMEQQQQYQTISPQQAYPGQQYGMQQYYAGGQQQQVPMSPMMYQHQPQVQQHVQPVQQQDQEQAQHEQPYPSQQEQQSACPWRAATSTDGKVYYYNQITMETRWGKPAGMQ